MTVSRALSNSPSVKDETRLAVHRRAAELGYVKSAAATTMRGNDSRIVGLLLPNIVNEFYASFANQMALDCEQRNLQLMIHLTNDNPMTELQSVRRLSEQQVPSIVMVPTPGGLPETERYLKNHDVVQLIRTRDMALDSSQLLIDETSSIAASVDLLKGKGHRFIAYIGGYEELSSGRNRLHAFRQAMSKNNLIVPHELIATGSPSFSMGLNSVENLWALPLRPTAIICGGFEISNGALEACLRLNLKLPNDVAFVGFGDPYHYRWTYGGVTTISFPVEEMATRVIDHIATMLEKSTESRLPRFSSTLIERKST